MTPFLMSIIIAAFYTSETFDAWREFLSRLADSNTKSQIRHMLKHAIRLTGASIAYWGLTFYKLPYMKEAGQVVAASLNAG